MKREREGHPVSPLPLTLTTPQRVEARGSRENIVVHSPYGSTRAQYGWGNLFLPLQPAVVPGYSNIFIGLSSLNAVPGKSDRSMATLLKQYRRLFNCLEHCYPYHKIGEPEAWLQWAEMARNAGSKSAPLGAACSTVKSSNSVEAIDAHHFVYTVKANNYLTHVKQLAMDAEVEEHLDLFFNQRCALLGPHLGPVLIQLPPSFQRTPQNMRRLTELHGHLRKDIPSYKADVTSGCHDTAQQRRLQIAVEFRHRSWSHPEVYDLLRNLGWALVVAHHHDDQSFAKHIDTGTDFMYVRLHGAIGTYVGDYGPQRMDLWAEEVANFLGVGEGGPADQPRRQVFFFLNNNDSHVGGATSSVVDASYLAQRLRNILPAPSAIVNNETAGQAANTSRSKGINDTKIQDIDVVNDSIGKPVYVESIHEDSTSCVEVLPGSESGATKDAEVTIE